jgi:hypothetical protein
MVSLASGISTDGSDEVLGAGTSRSAVPAGGRALVRMVGTAMVADA